MTDVINNNCILDTAAQSDSDTDSLISDSAMFTRNINTGAKNEKNSNDEKEQAKTINSRDNEEKEVEVPTTPTTITSATIAKGKDRIFEPRTANAESIITTRTDQHGSNNYQMTKNNNNSNNDAVCCGCDPHSNSNGSGDTISIGRFILCIVPRKWQKTSRRMRVAEQQRGRKAFEGFRECSHKTISNQPTEAEMNSEEKKQLRMYISKTKTELLIALFMILMGIFVGVVIYVLAGVGKIKIESTLQGKSKSGSSNFSSGSSSGTASTTAIKTAENKSFSLSAGGATTQPDLFVIAKATGSADSTGYNSASMFTTSAATISHINKFLRPTVSPFIDVLSEDGQATVDNDIVALMTIDNQQGHLTDT